MGAMASWEDGPEYAPRERPAGFAMPVAEPLEIAPAEVSPAAGAPQIRPEFSEPSLPAPPLAGLAPQTGPTRDARTPFSVAAMTMTQQTSAWGAAHSSILQAPGTASAVGGFDPTRPFQVAKSIDTRSAGTLGADSFAPPSGAPVGTYAPPDAPPMGQFGPPNGAPMGPPRHSGPVGVADVWRELTPGVGITLLIGCFLPFLSLVMYGLAFAFATRIRRETAIIRGVFIGGSSLLGLVGIVGLITTTDFADWWLATGWWALAISWVTLGTVVFLIYRSLTGGRLRSTPF